MKCLSFLVLSGFEHRLSRNGVSNKLQEPLVMRSNLTRSLVQDTTNSDKSALVDGSLFVCKKKGGGGGGGGMFGRLLTNLAKTKGHTMKYNCSAVLKMSVLSFLKVYIVMTAFLLCLQCVNLYKFTSSTSCPVTKLSYLKRLSYFRHFCLRLLLQIICGLYILLSIHESSI